MLLRYYIRAIIIPASLMLLVYIILVVFGMLEEASYESEMISDGHFYAFWFLVILFHALLTAVLALPLFLNKYAKVKNNRVFSGTLWFSAPIIWMVSLVIADLDYMLEYRYIGWYHYLIVHGRLLHYGSIVPYLIGLFITYRQFRKNLDKEWIKR